MIQKAINFAQTRKAYSLSVQPPDGATHQCADPRCKAAAGQLPRKKVVEAAASGSRTKMCTQPWTRFTLAANGALFPLLRDRYAGRGQCA